MTTTVPDGLWDPRESVRVAEAAATSARQNRSAAQEAARLAGALADRRAAADTLVSEAARRLRAVRGLHPARALQTAVGERDAVVAGSGPT